MRVVRGLVLWRLLKVEERMRSANLSLLRRLDLLCGRFDIDVVAAIEDEVRMLLREQNWQAALKAARVVDRLADEDHSQNIRGSVDGNQNRSAGASAR